jgi:hypothetical protein
METYLRMFYFGVEQVAEAEGPFARSLRNTTRNFNS